MNNYQVSEEPVWVESSLTIDLGSDRGVFHCEEITIGDDWTNLLFAWH